MLVGLRDDHPLVSAFDGLHAAIDGLVAASAAMAASEGCVADGVLLAELSEEELMATRRLVNLLELHFATVTWRYTKTAAVDPDSRFDEDPERTIRQDCRMTEHTVSVASAVGAQRDKLTAATAALADGRIGIGHLGYIADLAGQIARCPDARTDLFDERALVTAAGRMSVGSFRRLCQDIRHQSLYDSFVREEQSDEWERYLELRSHQDGFLEIRGGFEPEAAAIIRTVLEPLARKDGPEDRRKVVKRNADALVEACHHVLDKGSLRRAGGVRPHLYVTCDVPTLQGIAGAHAGDLQGVAMVSSAKVGRLACDSTIMRVLVNSAGMPVNVGRAQRVVQTATRRALIARDKGCVWPGCDRGVSWTHAHHMQEWVRGGRTDVKDLVLLCYRHHWMVHEGNHRVLRKPDGEVMVIPPGPGGWKSPGRDPTAAVA